MIRQAKGILKFLNIYHPLQSFYRGSINYLVNQYYKTTYAKYKGSGYTCNFCGASYQKFVPEYPSPPIADAINRNQVIAGYGENVFCPSCMSKNRERLVLAVMQSLLNIDNKTVLHFSPEKHLYQYLKDKAQVTTVDIIPGFYKTIDRAVTYADATHLKFAVSSFDIVIANHILEHIARDVQAMKEMYRVLKTGGVAILQVPYSELLCNTIEEPLINDPVNQKRLFGQKDHVRIYALNDYIKRLHLAGFKVKVLTPEVLTQYRTYAIQENESVFLCYK